jgi:F-type H+-transporting ATPase subunit alpha
MPVEEQVAILWAGTNNVIDDVPVTEVQDFSAQYLEYMRSAHSSLLATIRDEKELSDATIEALQQATDSFKAGTQWASKAKVAATAS